MVYNKKGFPFVSDYKRDIFDKYTLIYWIQESYTSIFVFFSGDTFVWKAYLDIFAKKKYQNCFEFPKYLYLCTRKRKLLGYGVMVTLQILVLSFLVRIQVAQQNTSFLLTKTR